MITESFEYFNPDTVATAVGLLEHYGDDAKLLAGGHSLLPAMKLRLMAPTVLIDISQIDELKGITLGSDLRIGAGVTYAEIAKSAEVHEACPVLGECVAQIGDIQVRNKGTLGGSLAHADPAADLPAVVLALGATITVARSSGVLKAAAGVAPGGILSAITDLAGRVSANVTTREIAADDFFVGMLATAVEPNEILTAVSFPRLGRNSGAAYEKLRQPASRYAIVGVAAFVSLVGGKVSSARVAVTGAGPNAVRQPAVEQAIIGSDGSEAAIAAAAALAGEDMDYLGDIHASDEYRKAMVKVYTKRALTRAIAQAR